MTPARPRSRLPRASLYALGLAWFAPFALPYHRYPITAFYSEWLALGLAAVMLLVRTDAWRTADIPAIALAPVGFAVLLGLHVALGLATYAEQALVAALYLMWAALLVVLGRTLRQELGLAAVADTLPGSCWREDWRMPPRRSCSSTMPVSPERRFSSERPHCA